MAELTINAEEITAALRRYVDDYTPEVGTEQVGRIVEVGDLLVDGTARHRLNELKEHLLASEVDYRIPEGRETADG